MKFHIGLFFSILIVLLISCTGPRNIYSSSPFVSPVTLEKKATSVGVDYFSHVRQRNVRDSVPGNHDNCFGINLSHMLTERTLVFASMDINNERNQFADSIALSNDPSFNAYNGGFDSSIVFGKRHSVGAGIELFSRKSNFALAMSVGFHQMSLDESGLLHQLPYQRFYKMNQISFSIQPAFLFRLSNSLKLAWLARLTIVDNFKAKTDYSDVEKLSANLQDKKMNLFVSFTGLYAEYQPLKTIPLIFNGQFFNDLSIWNHGFERYEPNFVYLKGTGASIGMKFIFK
jgi:hypothetical protein